MKGGQAVAKTLKIEGTEFVTLYPMVSITKELVEEKIRVIIPRHERTAVAIADAYTRCSMGHKNGVCLVQPQQGAQNILGGLAQAYDDLSPILMLPDGVRMNQLDSRAWDSTKNFGCVTKWSARINSAVRVP